MARTGDSKPPCMGSTPIGRTMLNKLTELFIALELEFPYSSCGESFLGAPT